MRSICRRPLVRLALGLVLAPAWACQSSADERDEKRRGQPEPYVPLPDPEVQPIGFFLANFDRSLVQWSDYKLNSSSKRDQNALIGLEHEMAERARERRDELVEVLETGAPVNRRIAAAALGFTRDATVLSTLLSALSEPDAELVQKSLLALGVLALPETPLGGILQRLREDPDAWTRNNAAFALLGLARAGNDAPELVIGCIAGLADSEPGVRAQCASSLGALAAPSAVPSLSELLHDPVNLVALAAAASLARIGREHAEQKGRVARALAGALDQVRADRRLHLLGALRHLAGDNLGEDAGPWLEWAHKLP
jgi:HEAT repeat protein